MPSITIQGSQFTVPDELVSRFVPGYVLQSEGEANALKQTFLENLRNNFAARIKKEMNGSDSLSPEAEAKLQGEFQTYAEEYQFAQRGTRVVVDPVEREMLKLAKEDIRKAFAAKYGKEAKLEKDDLNEKAEMLIERRHDEYAKRAKAILRQRENAGTSALEELGL